MRLRTIMRLLARWHIWLGWLVGVPLLLWTASGLVMVARPIEEVRGAHLRRGPEGALLPPGNPTIVIDGIDTKPGVREIRTFMQRGRPITLVTRGDGALSRFDARTGELLRPLDEAAARKAVASEIIGGDRVESVKRFPASEPPLDFRKPVAAWQVRLADGTHVYVGVESGEIEAVRTRFWRVFDFMWGLHIMDLETREDTHHPILIGFAALALLGCLMGTVLLFRRRQRPLSSRN